MISGCVREAELRKRERYDLAKTAAERNRSGDFWPRDVGSVNRRAAASPV